MAVIEHFECITAGVLDTDLNCNKELKPFLLILTTLKTALIFPNEDDLSTVLLSSTTVKTRKTISFLIKINQSVVTFIQTVV